MSRPAIDLIPVGLRVEKRSVLVVGAGRIAARKTAPYVDHGAFVTVVAPDHCAEMNELNVVHRVSRPFEFDDLDGMWLVVAATGDPIVDGAVFAEAERRRIFCNAADDPDHCSVILPAVARRGDLTVTISTGGRSPATATWLRRRINRILDEPTSAAFAVAANVRDERRSAGLATEVPGWQEALDAYEEDLRRRLAAADVGMVR